jgi:hypothetical protein
MGQRGSEKGIKDDVDYGTAFLDARKGAAGAGGDEPPAPPPAPVPLPPSGKSVGQIVLFLVLSLTVIAGGVGLFVLTGDGGDASGDLISEGGGVEIADRDRRVTTTTTEATTTTTEATTTTTQPPTSTTQLGATTVPNQGSVVPVVTTIAPACPSGGVSSAVGGTWTSIVGGDWRVDFTGSSTTNNTTAAIKLNVEVPITYVDDGGSSQVIAFRPDQYGQTIAPGATVNWSGVRLIRDAPQQPAMGSATGRWAWADPAFATCEVGAFS